MKTEVSAKSLTVIKKMQLGELTESIIYEKISKFAKENSEADNTKRLTNEMVNLWKISQDNIIS